MQIKSLDLKNFRNYRELSISFSDGVNIIYGENAQGKTNILESISLCGVGKSHRRSKEKEMIRISAEEAHIKGMFQKESVSERIDIHLKRSGSKGIAINRIPIKKISELYGNVNVVIFSPEDLDLIKGGPSLRRNFINQELCQIDPIYVEDLIHYSRILKQRHELFRNMESDPQKKEELLETLEIWDLQLSKYGSRIIQRRRTFLEEMNTCIFDIHYDLTDGKEKLKLVYEPSASEDTLYEELIRNREKDRIYKQTSVGPHRDDLLFYENEKNMKIYGSQGQQRTCVLSLKLAEMKMIEWKKKEKPILLLDDVLSELDRNRQIKLIKGIKDTQTIITCTGLDELIESEVSHAEKFYIRDAAVSTKKEG